MIFFLLLFSIPSFPLINIDMSLFISPEAIRYALTNSLSYSSSHHHDPALVSPYLLSIEETIEKGCRICFDIYIGILIYNRDHDIQTDMKGIRCAMEKLKKNLRGQEIYRYFSNRFEETGFDIYREETLSDYVWSFLSSP